MANADTRVITSHAPVPLADQVDALAARMERSRGWIVKQALADFVALEKRRYRLTLEGLASIDVGEGVQQEELESSARSPENRSPRVAHASPSGHNAVGIRAPCCCPHSGGEGEIEVRTTSSWNCATPA